MNQNLSNEIIDELAIRSLAGRYCDAVMRRDAEAWASTWCEDAVWEILGNRIEGRETIVDTWKQFMQGYPIVIHAAFPGLVNINDDTAKCRWYVTEKVRDLEGKNTQFFGVYNDVCEKINDEWLFTERRFDLIYQGPTELDMNGWTGYPADLNPNLTA